MSEHEQAATDEQEMEFGQKLFNDLMTSPNGLYEIACSLATFSALLEVYAQVLLARSGVQGDDGLDNADQAPAPDVVQNLVNTGVITSEEAEEVLGKTVDETA